MTEFNTGLLIVLSFILFIVITLTVSGAIMEKSRRINRILDIIDNKIDRPLSHILAWLEGDIVVGGNNTSQTKPPGYPEDR